MKISFAEPRPPKKGVVVVFVGEGGKLGDIGLAIDKQTGGAVTRAMSATAFKAKSGATLTIPGPTGLESGVVLLVGIGESSALDGLKIRGLGASAYEAVRNVAAGDGVVCVDFSVESRIGAPRVAADVAFGARLRHYRFDRHITKERPNDKPAPGRFTVLVRSSATARRRFTDMETLAEAVDFTRNIVSEPGNIIYPATLAAECESLQGLGLKIEVLGVRQMKAMGMGALLGVAQGSVNEPRLVVLQWQGGKRNQKPLALVGKGVTFDSGGISLKPAAGMEDMKWDMGGSAAVIGAMHALAGRKARANVVGIIGLVENMPSGSAQRPGDIVHSMSGQSIEVLNTDAEGRLVLADALWYAQDRFKPRAMIDLATLTGAVVVALGMEYAGYFSNDEALAAGLEAASRESGERIWRMPLDEAYDKLIDGDAADVKNISSGRWGGSITAAQFLQRFTNKVPWAHLDIAGVAWANKDRPLMAKGATAFGVQLLDALVRAKYEG